MIPRFAIDSYTSSSVRLVRASDGSVAAYDAGTGRWIGKVENDAQIDEPHDGSGVIAYACGALCGLVVGFLACLMIWKAGAR